jgi:hypothetical protein
MSELLELRPRQSAPVARHNPSTGRTGGAGQSFFFPVFPFEDGAEQSLFFPVFPFEAGER